MSVFFHSSLTVKQSQVIAMPNSCAKSRMQWGCPLPSSVRDPHPWGSRPARGQGARAATEMMTEGRTPGSHL